MLRYTICRQSEAFKEHIQIVKHENKHQRQLSRKSCYTDSMNPMLLEVIQIIPTRVPLVPIRHNYSSQERAYLKKRLRPVLINMHN